MDIEKKGKPEGENSELAGNLFNGSIALLAVCLTVITIFQVSNNRLLSIVDDVLCVSSGLFTISVFMSYLSIRKQNLLRLQRLADRIFIMGLLTILVAGITLSFDL